jgi:phosphatidylserine/phosphatidylglycerophosphate/cardiolipin synthase-like enzyme
MGALTEPERVQVQNVIAENIDALSSIPNFVTAEPGFAIVDGVIVKEPSIIVYVSRVVPPTELLEEQRAPAQLGPFPVAVMQADPLRQLAVGRERARLPEIVLRDVAALTYEPIEGDPINEVFEVETPVRCHVGPDAGYRTVLEDFIKGTQESLSVAMYDYNAKYISKTFIETVRSKNVKVTMTLDDGTAQDEDDIWEDHKSKLGDAFDGWIVRCSPNRRFPNAYHEKVAVRDSRAFWLSSGNWSRKSQPDNDPVGQTADRKGMYGKGNREWHVIVEHEGLAQLFERYIKHDRDGSEAEAAEDREVRLVPPDLFVPIDELVDATLIAEEGIQPIEPKLLPSDGRPVTIEPVLTPDNYIDKVFELISGAEQSVHMQFSYINYSNEAGDERFTEVLMKLGELSRQPGFDMRIILNSRDAVAQAQTLVQEADFKDLTVFKGQANVHNKGIVVDGRSVLVSSANWSPAGALRNRDAGLIIHDPEIAAYFEGVFDFDWNNRANDIVVDRTVMLARQGAPTPPGMVRISWQEYFDD